MLTSVDSSSHGGNQSIDVSSDPRADAELSKEDGVELKQVVINPMLDSSPHVEGEGQFVIKILFRESKIEIFDLPSAQAKVSELKNLVAEKCSIPVHRQRLIFNGKTLKPDSSSLDLLGVSHMSCIHLFPLPETQPTALQPTSSCKPLSTALDVFPFLCCTSH